MSRRISTLSLSCALTVGAVPLLAFALEGADGTDQTPQSNLDASLASTDKSANAISIVFTNFEQLC